MGCSCFRDKNITNPEKQEIYKGIQINLKTNKIFNQNLHKMQELNKQFQQNIPQIRKIHSPDFHQHLKKQQDYLNQICCLYKQCKHYYESHDIDTAGPIAKQILDLIHQMRTKGFHFQCPEGTQVQMCKKLNAIIQQLYDLKHYQKQIEKGGWQEKSNRNGIKVSIRRDQNDTVGCLVQSTLDVPFQIFIAFLIQMDLYKEFIPFTQKSQQKKQISRNRRIGYSLNNIPIISKRQAYFEGIGYNRLNHPQKQLFMFTRSLHDRPDLQQMLDFRCSINKKYVAIDYNYFVLRYRPLRKDFGQVILAMNVDAKIGFAPLWLMEYISRDYGQNFFANLVKLSKKYKGSKWQENVTKNPNFFQFAKDAVQQFIKRQQLQGSVRTN